MTDLEEPIAVPFDPVVEVVRRQERQVSAAVPVRLHDVVHMGGDVLLVTREDHEVVEPRELRAVPNTLEIVVGKDVRGVGAQAQPPEETLVVAAEVRRDAAVQERPGEIDAADPRIGVPGIAGAVVIDVTKVVGLPRTCRKHNGHAALPETTGRTTKGANPCHPPGLFRRAK